MPNSLRRIAPNPQLAPINIVSPGRLGLNLQQSNTILPPEWCTAADNGVIDYSGRVAARFPLNTVSTQAAVAPILSIFEQVDAAHGNTLVFAYNGGISSSPGTPNNNNLAAIGIPVQSPLTTSGAAGSLAANTTYFYVVTALNANGETIASNEQSITTGAGATNENTVSWSSVTGATGYRVYRGTSAGGENVFYAPGLVTSFLDTGAASTGGMPPTQNTATVAAPAVFANGNWLFYNFNNKVIGIQAGQAIIVRTVGTFAPVVASFGSPPTGGVGTAAYGRVWQVQSDGQTIQYSALLDETNWDTTGANGDGGLFNMQKVWPHGTDTVQAIVAYNHNIVVFGLRNIVFLASPDVTALGMDVTQLAVVDVIEGTGCVDPHTIQHIGDTDLVWLSPTGVQSMQRLLVQRSRPTSTITKYVRDALIAQLINETQGNMRSAYSPTYGFYAVSFPASKFTWVVDMRRVHQDQDGEMVAPVTRWTVAPTGMFETIERQLYTSSLTSGMVAQYVNGTENGGTYQFVFQTTWMDLGTDIATRFKMLKRIGAVLFVRANVNIVFTFNTDFNPTGTSQSVNSSGNSGSEWNIAQWNINEWSGGNLLQLLHVPAYATAQYFQFSITANVAGNFAVQQAELFAKVGKIAH